jgi:FMN phosphatase YigB (HAD superfamily)
MSFDRSTSASSLPTTGGALRTDRGVVLRRAAARVADRLRALTATCRPGAARCWTFDVFDTSITRLVLRPDHLHWLVATRARGAGLLETSPDVWRRTRIAAEDEARRRAGGVEITFDRIYDVIREGGAVPVAALAGLADLERQLERELARAMAGTRASVERLRRVGRPTVFVSDTYFSAGTIAALLDACGYAPGPHEVLASADHGASKWRGDLYARVAALHGLSCRELAHVGDNERSDVVNARRAGVAATRVDDARPTRYETLLFEHGGADEVASVAAGAARAARLSFEPDKPIPTGLVRVATGVAAPLLTAFVLWVLERARQDGVTRLHFLARDGQVLTKLARLAAAWSGVEIECRYLLGSRQAFHLASLPRDSAAAVDQILAEARTSRVGDLIDDLGLSDPYVSSELAGRGVAAGDRVEAHRTAIRAVLADPIVLNALTARRERRAAGLRRYLEEAGFFDSDRPAIVDLGWKGNLQRRLERACQHRPLRGYYYDLDHVPADLAGSTATFAGGAPRNAELLEAFCMADHTSIQGFDQEPGGRPVALLDSWRDDAAHRWGVEVQQRAIVRFAEGLFAALPHEHYPATRLIEALRPAGLAVFRTFVESPSRGEAEAYGSVAHARGERHTDLADLAPRLTSRALCRAMISRRFREDLRTWMPGSLVRSQDSLAGSLALSLLRIRQQIRRRGTVHRGSW